MDEPVAKKRKVNALEGFLSLPGRRRPTLLCESKDIADRDSVFRGYASPAVSKHAAMELQSYVRDKVSDGVFCMLGYRLVGLRIGRSGMSVDDFVIESGGDDDDEKGAQATIKRVLGEVGAVDIAVVVTRVYGGTMLGPVRFEHIANATREATLKLQELIALNSSYESALKKIETLSKDLGIPYKPPNRDKADVEKLRRLVKASEAKTTFLEKRKADRDKEERLKIANQKRQQFKEKLTSAEQADAS